MQHRCITASTQGRSVPRAALEGERGLKGCIRSGCDGACGRLVKQFSSCAGGCKTVGGQFGPTEAVVGY